ncbi:uncharacterized protein PAC_00978 [Phialocephala subalpina]|uniref:Uncharacterized protein n=1 Tax=Phialocephala subalpina TaxID=576137 RepID=A0A1L7WE93_9HELO|nr:uncharacterized protein PAC_00978 [Phialocephala subalpina]
MISSIQGLATHCSVPMGHLGQYLSDAMRGSSQMRSRNNAFKHEHSLKTYSNAPRKQRRTRDPSRFTPHPTPKAKYTNSLQGVAKPTNFRVKEVAFASTFSPEQQLAIEERHNIRTNKRAKVDFYDEILSDGLWELRTIAREIRSRPRDSALTLGRFGARAKNKRWSISNSTAIAQDMEHVMEDSPSENSDSIESEMTDADAPAAAITDFGDEVLKSKMGFSIKCHLIQRFRN